MREDAAMPGSLLDDDLKGADEPWSFFPADEDRAGAGAPTGPDGIGPGWSIGRRREPRYETNANLLWMQWWDGEEYLGRSARLVNVSRGGAMVVSSALLRERQAVRVYLEEPDLRAGVEATVLGVVVGRAGMNQVRLRFLSPCPATFFEAAAVGFESWLAGGR